MDGGTRIRRRIPLGMSGTVAHHALCPGVSVPPTPHPMHDSLPKHVLLCSLPLRRSCWQGGRLLAEEAAVHSRSAAELLRGRVATPALVYDLARLGTLADVARRVRERSGARVLYAIKACAFSDVLQVLAPSLDGFAVSSLFEARLVHDLYPDSPIHLTTPGPARRRD